MFYNNGVLDKSNTINYDTGFTFGKGVFETILVQDRPVLLAEHLKRLNAGLDFLDIKKQIIEEEVLQAVKALNCKNEALKIVISDSNTLFVKRPIGYSEKDYEQGARLCLSTVVKSSHSPTISIKSTNYMDNLIELQNARKRGYTDALFKNEKGFVTETCVSNIFVIQNGNVYTPPLACGLLAGIIRQWVMNNFSVTEKKLTVDDIVNSDAVFVTNSLLGIMQVLEIDGKHWKINKNIMNIRVKYTKMLEKYCEQ